MTIRLYMLLIVFCLITKTAIAQSLSSEEKAKYVGYLDSAYTPLVQEALWAIRENQITEAVPTLERNIWRQDDPYVQLYFLKVIWKLRSPNTLAFARAFIDTTDTFRFKKIFSFTDSLMAKVDATEILLDLGDYSTVHYVFDILKRDSISSYYKAVGLLAPITLKVPEYAEKARIELIRIALHDSDDQIRWTATTYLAELYGSQANDVLLQVTVNDLKDSNRIFALMKLITYYPQIKQLLNDRLYKESPTYRDLIADTLLLRYGTPQDYQTVKEYLAWESDTINKTLVGYRLRNFKPRVPTLSTSVLTLLDSLIAYKHQCAAYNWLGDQNFLNELDNGLENAQKHLAKGDSVNCSREIGKFQDKVQNEYEKTQDNKKKSKPKDKRFVTEEGYNFLYINAQYIIDRLPGKKQRNR